VTVSVTVENQTH